MINGDHAQPKHTCAACRGKGWIDDMSSARRYLRPCPACEQKREPVSTPR